jgi:CO dehydrogenase/acetyl-CoA synthase gamma subunit (corrinoid Fe-S protein)
MLKDELEELSGLQVVAGPREAQGIPEFLRKQAQEAGQG